MTVTGRLARILRRRPSRIGLRLFTFNLLVLFVPLAGILYLDVYESKLLETQERAMVQQARFIAAAVSSTNALDESTATDFLSRIEDAGDVRIRIFDLQGTLLADSVRTSARTDGRSPDAYLQVANPRRRLLYQIGAALVRLRDIAASAVWGWLSRGGVEPTVERARSGIQPELRAALAGRYGAAVRSTPGQRSLTLNSAVPVRGPAGVMGAVVVSQSTFRILQALYDVRLRLFEIVLLSIAAAAVLTGVASATIVKPLGRLRQTAAALATRQAALSGSFSQVDRTDEIGDLARSLEELASRLDAQIQLLESVSADVAHEFRNPLAAIRTAAETMAEDEDPVERRRFLGMLTRDIGRLEALVTGVRELARIDAELSSGPRDRVDLVPLLKGLVEGRQLLSNGRIRLDLQLPHIVVNGSADRLSQVFENLLDNAASFSPADAPVQVSAAVQGSICVIGVEDRGPGIPPAHAQRVFERFFSYRPESNRRHHMGLGLSIARAIVNGYGGSIDARNRDEGGAVFEVRLPVIAESQRLARLSHG